jgi:anti-sigma B factor antagonist
MVSRRAAAFQTTGQERRRMQSSAMSVFDLAVRPDRSQVVVGLEGELDLATVPRLARAVEELRAVGWESIVLDLSGAEFVDSSGLRLLLDLDGRARGEGWRFALRGECRAFERLLGVSGLRDWFVRA